MSSKLNEKLIVQYCYKSSCSVKASEDFKQYLKDLRCLLRPKDFEIISQTYNISECFLIHYLGKRKRERIQHDCNPTKTTEQFCPKEKL